jgi:hypothetical protein
MAKLRKRKTTETLWGGAEKGLIDQRREFTADFREDPVLPPSPVNATRLFPT